MLFIKSEEFFTHRQNLPAASIKIALSGIAQAIKKSRICSISTRAFLCVEWKLRWRNEVIALLSALQQRNPFWFWFLFEKKQGLHFLRAVVS